MKKAVVWVTSISFLFVPVLSQSQTSELLGKQDSLPLNLAQGSSPGANEPKDDCAEGKKAGEKEGARDTNLFRWGLYGFLFGTGVVAAQFTDPGHPSEAAPAGMANKACFEQGYRGKKKSRRLVASSIGLVILAGVGTALIVASVRKNPPQIGGF